MGPGTGVGGFPQAPIIHLRGLHIPPPQSPRRHSLGLWQPPWLFASLERLGSVNGKAWIGAGAGMGEGVGRGTGISISRSGLLSVRARTEA